MTAENPLPNLTFEPMHLDDLQQVLEIENQCFEDPWSKTYFTVSLKRPRSYEHFTSHGEGAVVGYIIFNILHEEAHLLNIAVPPANQRQGIGKYLLASALEMIQADDGTRGVLGSRCQQSTGAISLPSIRVPHLWHPKKLLWTL